MPRNIHAQRALRLVALGLLVGSSGLIAQAPCPPGAATAVLAAWAAYRTDSLDRAAERFTQVLDACPKNRDAQVGLGFTLLRLDRVAAADSLFLTVLNATPANADAWEGRARAAFRRGDSAALLAAGRRAVALNPGNQELRTLLDRAAPDWDRVAGGPRRRPMTLQVAARTRGRRFEVPTGGHWRPFYVRGVNLGAALPGRHPSEFPADSARYAGWLDTLAAMHANTLRVYTIFPPAFYRALRAFNVRHPSHAIWLIHGVWTELPPGDDFGEPRWQGEFRSEMRRVVDLVHGAATIPSRPGHAGGRYDADVSRWTLAYIIGREWEPYAVQAFDRRRRTEGSYAGRFLAVAHAPAMDLWLAEQCDSMLAYEVDSYNGLRPIAYTNWPTLDPLAHSTEPPAAEEALWRQRAGRPTERKSLELENDAVELDANLVRPTRANPAGWFASFHAYPYYPDFIQLDRGYSRAQSPEGPSNYFGYLQELVTHHAGMPTLISEYGVPSSRGMAHYGPQGWNHGGHDERAMAAIDARLTREIKESGAAGSVLFAWMDEWFKKNWMVIDFEIPLDHTRLWHNVMDAEQNYGILGQYAGEAGSPRLGGDPTRWRALPAIEERATDARRAPHTLRAGADESYVYLAVELTPGRFPWDSLGIQLAIDTYLSPIGQHLVLPSGLKSEVGFEFLVDLRAPDSATIRVTPDYNRHAGRPSAASGDDLGQFTRRPVAPVDREDGRFDSLFVTTNRARFGRDGTFFPARGYDRGLLSFGTEAHSSLADWYVDETAGLLELRLPWDLLNVTDPSSRTLLYDRDSVGEFGTAGAGEFHFGVLVWRKGAVPGVVGAMPPLQQGSWRAADFIGWHWAGWSEPRSHAGLKPVYDSLKTLWSTAP
jgi:hypothetical protein